jgi:hypothetical protein
VVANVESSPSDTGITTVGSSYAKDEKKAMKKARAKEGKGDKGEVDKAHAELSVKYAPLSGPVNPCYTLKHLPQPDLQRILNSMRAAELVAFKDVRGFVPLATDRKGASRQIWEPLDEEKWWRIEYSKKYRSVIMSFMKTLAGGGE